MTKITKAQYEFALARIEELLPMVDDNTPANDRNAVDNASSYAWLLIFSYNQKGKKNDDEHSAPHSLVMFNRDGMRQKSVSVCILEVSGRPRRSEVPLSCVQSATK